MIYSSDTRAHEKVSFFPLTGRPRKIIKLTGFHDINLVPSNYPNPFKRLNPM